MPMLANLFDQLGHEQSLGFRIALAAWARRGVMDRGDLDGEVRGQLRNGDAGGFVELSAQATGTQRRGATITPVGGCAALAAKHRHSAVPVSAPGRGYLVGS
jgi:hypothetical protein